MAKGTEPRWKDAKWIEEQPWDYDEGGGFKLNPTPKKRGTLETVMTRNAADSLALKQKSQARQAAAAQRNRQSSFMAERNRLAGQLQSQQDAANRANESRYGSALAAVAGIGNQARQDIQTNTDRSMSHGLQSMMSRGMSNATVLGAMQRRSAEEANRGYANLGERMAGMRANIYQSRTDAGPNPQSYMQPMANAGAGMYQPPAGAPLQSAVSANTVNPQQAAMEAVLGKGRFKRPTPPSAVTKPV